MVIILSFYNVVYCLPGIGMCLHGFVTWNLIALLQQQQKHFLTDNPVVFSHLLSLRSGTIDMRDETVF